MSKELYFIYIAQMHSILATSLILCILLYRWSVKSLMITVEIQFKKKKKLFCKSSKENYIIHVAVQTNIS